MKKIKTNKWKLKKMLQFEDKCTHNVICYMIWDNHNFKILENVDKVTVKTFMLFFFETPLYQCIFSLNIYLLSTVLLIPPSI